MILWNGYCPTHAKLLAAHVEAARERFGGAPIIVHPESRGQVCLAADHVLSTGQMCAFAAKSDAKQIVVGTEVGLLHRLRKENPDKIFIPLLESATCPNMKKNTIEKMVWCLEDLTGRITVDKEISSKAKRSVSAMFEDGPIEPRKDLPQ
jgi:quinolinate synthase